MKHFQKVVQNWAFIRLPLGSVDQEKLWNLTQISSWIPVIIISSALIKPNFPEPAVICILLRHCINPEVSRILAVLYFCQHHRLYWIFVKGCSHNYASAHKTHLHVVSYHQKHCIALLLSVMWNVLKQKREAHYLHCVILKYWIKGNYYYYFYYY